MNYNVLQPNFELRAVSREQLKGVWGKMALAILVYYLITILPQFIFWEYGLNIPFLNTLVSIAIVIISGPITLGLAGYFLRRIRGEEIFIENIFDGFKRFLPSFLLTLLMGLFVFLWALLLIIPGIIKGYGYSMAFYIMYDNPGIKPLDALKKSQNMMKGYKGKYFLLGLSFLGWSLLGILTLGIGYLWLTPYVSLAYGNFYENLKKHQEEAVTEDKRPDAGQNIA
ncbi:MAG: DUF975 family protein [Treponema sp.]|nr:DUF975 family protein [Treponema sp.]